MNRRRLSVVVWLITVWLALPAPVAAYLDPGTGSMLVQGIIAVIAASVAAAGMYWRALSDFVRKLTGRTSASNADRPKEP
jgi:hypothetical protein